MDDPAADDFTEKTVPARLVPTRPDAEVAEDLRQRMIAAYAEPLQIFEEGLQKGFLMNAEVQRDPYGKLIVRVKIIREF